MSNEAAARFWARVPGTPDYTATFCGVTYYAQYVRTDRGFATYRTFRGGLPRKPVTRNAVAVGGLPNVSVLYDRGV